MTRPALALALSLALLGCASTQTAGTQSAGLPLQDTVAAVEITSDGQRLSIPAAGIADVDINSTIGLTMNPTAIATAASKAYGAPAAAGAPVDVTPELRAMDDVTKAEQASSAYLQKLVAALSAGRAPSDAERRRLGTLQQNVVAAVRSYAAVANLDPAARAAFFSAPGYSALVPAINQERSRLLAQVQSRLEQLPNLRWRMEATSSRTGGIHLPNYDDLPEGTTTIVNKIAVQVDDQTKQEFAAATSLSSDINKLIDQQGSLGAAVQQVLLDEARQAAAAWEDWAKQDVTTIETLIASLKKSAADDKDAQTVIANAGALVREAQALKAACAGVSGVLQNIVETHAVPADLSAVTTCAEKVKADLPMIADQVKAAATSAQALLGKIDAAAGATLAALKAQVPSLQTVVHAKEALDKVQAAWTTFAGALDAKKNLPPPAWRSDHFQDRPLDSTLDTAIILTKVNPRQDGDAIYVRPILVKDGAPLVTGVEQAFTVRKEGARVDVGAVVTFVHPRSLRQGEDPFRAAPAVAAALHYRDRRAAGESTGNRFWNFIDPGIGFHVLYPDLGHTQLDATGKVVSTDPSAEIGLGGVVQLFGDLFQAGYGYDIQVDRGYWYFGLGLHRLIDLGITLPAGGSRSTANQ